MDRMDFNQAVMRVKVLEKRLLSRARVERMIEAKDVSEVYRILQETEYQGSFIGVENPYDYEVLLNNELKRVYGLMDELTGEKVITDIISLRYFYHNLKVMVKEYAQDSKLDSLYVDFGYDIKAIKSAFLSDNYENIDPIVEKALKETKKVYEETDDPQKIDIILDKYYFIHLNKLVENVDIPLFLNYVKDLIDFTNIKTLLRVRKLGKDIRFLEEVLVPGGNISLQKISLSINDDLDTISEKFEDEKIGPKIVLGIKSFKETNRLSEYEKIMDNSLMDLNEESKTIIFGPEPLFSYLYAKETENKILRMIMVSKLNNLSPEIIRERLRDLYV